MTLFAAGVNSPPPQGVGVYAIPSNKWSTAITDGWPIISETGGLGTQSAPWVGFTSPRASRSSPDFLMGQCIYNAHKRVTWLSFWTVSGPLASQPETTATYYAHGFAAGAWVADPDRPVPLAGRRAEARLGHLRPRGLPRQPLGPRRARRLVGRHDCHVRDVLESHVGGWSAGIPSVDPSLKPGVYASQSEYRNYSIATPPLPVFMAVAFGNGGPVPVAGASGSNIRGFISFSAVCTPTSTSPPRSPRC